jgi:UPF0176 protein
MAPLVVTLFYCYCDVDGVNEHVADQRVLLESLSLKGRVRIASEGINGTVCGGENAVARYEAATLAAFAPGGSIDFKRSACEGQAFSSLQVRAVREVVTLGVPPDELSFRDAAEHISPVQFRDLVLSAAPRDDLIVLDVRNTYESEIGHFSRAVRPRMRQFADFPAWATENAGMLEGSDVVLYCTGGVRCERASAFLIKRIGLDKRRIRQLRGGIVRFLDAIPDGGNVWHGRNLVFDARQTNQGSARVVGRCCVCRSHHDDYTRNLRCVYCRGRLLVCHACAAPRLCRSCQCDYEGGRTRRAAKLEARLAEAGVSR